MNNSFKDTAIFVAGIVFVLIAVLLALTMDDRTDYSIVSITLFISGSACCIYSCSTYVKWRSEQDFFHLE